MKKIVVLILIISLSFGLFGCYSLSRVSDNLSKTAEKLGETAEKLRNNEIEFESVEKLKEKPLSLTVGDTAVLKNFKVTAEEIQESPGDDWWSPDDGKIFVGIKFTIENISDEDQNISTIILFDTYIDDVKADYSMDANIYFDEGTLDGDVSPGKKLVGWYAVEAPIDWTKIEVQIFPTWLSSSDSAAVFVFNK